MIESSELIPVDDSKTKRVFPWIPTSDNRLPVNESDIDTRHCSVHWDDESSEGGIRSLAKNDALGN